MADYQSQIEAFKAKKTAVVAGSADRLEDAQKMAERRKLTFPMAFGLDVETIARHTGAFYNAEKGFLHATGFILTPEGIVDEAVYSTGPIGRLPAADALKLIDYRSKP